MSLTFLAVYRDEWFRGQGSQKSRLSVHPLNLETGEDSDKPQRCCLGFMALECGHSEEQIINVPYPLDLREIRYGGVTPAQRLKWPEALMDAEKGGITKVIGAVNDDMDLEDKHREKVLVILFRHLLEVHLAFVDTRPVSHLVEQTPDTPPAFGGC